MGTEEEKAGDGGQWGDEGDLGEEVEEEVEKKKTKGMCAKLMKFFASLGGEHRAQSREKPSLVPDYHECSQKESD